MAFTNKNDHLTGRRPVCTPAGAEVVAARFTLQLVAADLDANDCGAIGILPAGCVPVGIVYDSDKLDSNGTPTLVAAVGLVNAGETDLSASWVTGITASQGGTAVHVVSKELVRVVPTNADRKVGLKFTAAAATKAPGLVGLTLLYRAA